jgi:hypothetical protein
VKDQGRPRTHGDEPLPLNHRRLRPQTRHAGAFDFAAQTYYSERAADRMAYLTLFPIGTSVRANLMVYRTMDDPCCGKCAAIPAQPVRIDAQFAPPPGDIEVAGPIKIPRRHRYQKGLQRRRAAVHIHVPSWLASPGMGADKIAQFYDDLVKRAYDDASASWAYRLRSMSIEEGFTWNLQRRLRFIVGAAIGAACQLGMIAIADQVAPEGWTQRIRDRT